MRLVWTSNPAMNATSTIERSRWSDTEQRSMTADTDWRHRTTTTKIQFHHYNMVFLLVALLLMILKETSAMPPIIKIGEWQIFPLSTVYTEYASIRLIAVYDESITHICIALNTTRAPNTISHMFARSGRRSYLLPAAVQR